MNFTIQIAAVATCLSLSSCGIQETFRAMEENRQAIEMSTNAINENIQAIQEANRGIAENRRQLEEINKALQKAAKEGG
jgi:methyl-accepting chemotaxis protein